MEKIIKEKIDNLDKTEVRTVFKIEIYQMYILPSLRFLLTVHEITKTHLKKLDVLTDQYVKRWIGLPRCATTEIIHAKYAMNIKTITALYKEAHCVTHVATRLKGDSLVNKILDNKIERESEFNRKHSITVEAEKVYQDALSMNTVQGIIPNPQGELTTNDNFNLQNTERNIPTYQQKSYCQGSSSCTGK